MDELEKIRLNAANALIQLDEQPDDTDPPTNKRQRALLTVDALAAHAIAALVHDPELHRLRQQLFAQFLTNQLPNPNPPPEPSVDGWPGT